MSCRSDVDNQPPSLDSGSTKYHPERAVAVEGVHGVRPHDDGSRLTPFTIAAGNGAHPSSAMTIRIAWCA